MKRIIGALIASSAIVDCAYSAPVVTLTGEYSGPVYNQEPVVATINNGQADLDINTYSLPFMYQSNSASGSADTAGNFALSAQVHTQGSTTTTYSYANTIHNSGSIANSYSINFLVPYISLDISGYWIEPMVATASYDYQILANGVSVFNSHGTLSSNLLDNISYDSSSDLFGLNLLDNFASSNSYSGTADLGIINSGQNLDLSVLVTLTTFISAPESCLQSISDCRLEAIAFLGDESSINSQTPGFNVTSAQVATVPLPPTAALFVSSLLGLGFARTKMTKPALAA